VGGVNRFADLLTRAVATCARAPSTTTQCVSNMASHSAAHASQCLNDRYQVDKIYVRRTDSVTRSACSWQFARSTRLGTHARQPLSKAGLMCKQEYCTLAIEPCGVDARFCFSQATAWARAQRSDGRPDVSLCHSATHTHSPTRLLTPNHTIACRHGCVRARARAFVRRRTWVIFSSP